MVLELKHPRASASSTTSSGSQVASTSPDFTKDEAQPTVPSTEEKSSPEPTALITDEVKSPDSQPASNGEEASPVEDLADHLELEIAETVEWIQSPLLQLGNQFELYLHLISLLTDPTLHLNQLHLLTNRLTSRQ